MQWKPMYAFSLTLSLSLKYAGYQNANIIWRTSWRYVSQCSSRNATGRLHPSKVPLIITLFKSGVTRNIPFHLFPSCRPHHQLVPPPHARRYVCKSRSARACVCVCMCVCVCVCEDTWALYVSAWTYILFFCIPVTSLVRTCTCKAYKPFIRTHTYRSNK